MQQTYLNVKSCLTLVSNKTNPDRIISYTATLAKTATLIDDSTAGQRRYPNYTRRSHRLLIHFSRVSQDFPIT